MNKKLYYIIPLLVLLLAGFAYAQGFDPIDGPGGTLRHVLNIVGNVFTFISQIFGFSWLNGNFAGFLRFLWWLLVFIVLFSAGTIVFGKIYGTTGAGTARRNAGIIAAILATTTAIFTPMSLLFWLFSTYTTIMLFIFIGVAIGGILAIIYPVLGKVMTGWPLRLARIIGILLCWAILAQVTKWADTLESTMTSPFPQTALLIAPFVLIFVSANEIRKYRNKKE